MANLNDFKLIKLKSRKMYDLKVGKEIQLEEIEKERFGFYHLILENVTGVIDTTGDLSYIIIDTFYNKKYTRSLLMI